MMNKITFKIALPIILTGIFAIIIFIALNYQNMSVNFYIVFFFLFIYTFLFGFAIGQNYSSPVKKLLKRATELSEGDLKTRIYLETKDELGELSKVFNKIAQNLEESRCAETRAEETIDIKVRARTQALEEVIKALEQKVKNRTIELEKIEKELNAEKQEKEKKVSELNNLNQELEKLKIELENNNLQVKKNNSKKIKKKEVDIKEDIDQELVKENNIENI